MKSKLRTVTIPSLGDLAYSVSDSGLLIATYFHKTSDRALELLCEMLDSLDPNPHHQLVDPDNNFWETAFVSFFSGQETARNPETIPLDMTRWTPFQKKVYLTLRDNVHWGETISYGELASLSGSPGAARAVGTAMAQNTGGPFIPCHRVISSGGRIGGYSGRGGIPLKRKLLRLESEIDISLTEGQEHL